MPLINIGGGSICPQLHNGDCLDVMKSIPDKSVNLVLTDPPYGIKYKSNARTKTRQFAVLKNDDNDFRFETYPEMYRVLKKNACCIVFCSWKNYAKDFNKLSELFDIKNVIVWWKKGGGMGDLKHTISTDYELAIICHKGKCEIRGKREGSVWQFNKVSPNKMVHATEKPVELLSHLVEKFTDEGDVILDPFMGSGSTGVACANTGRNFIGIELDTEYFKIAESRINEAFFYTQIKREEV